MKRVIWITLGALLAATAPAAAQTATEEEGVQPGTSEAVEPETGEAAEPETAEAEAAVVTEEAGPSEASSRSTLGDLVIGLHVGPSLSVFSDLEAHVMPRLELGYNLPVWGRRLEPHFTVAYTPPHASGSVADTRLPNGGEFGWEITEDELTLGLGLLVRFLELGSPVNGYAALGPQVVFLRTSVDGDAGGEAFGENTEDDVKVGLYGALGVELVLGPGAAFFQVGLAWSDLNGRVTGDSNTGNLSPALGYRLML